ncbi:P-loop containing nucleoside triphosphate hydrolase protein [Mycena rebaudengoi]|nr:P-loop containing nucleoside triphosphate hydrolase protein [Mycena rebaudengoi]
MLLSDTAVTSSSKTLISSYQPFYLPKEDTLPASESLAAAKRNYQMQVVTSLRRSPEEIASLTPRETDTTSSMDDGVVIAVMGPTGSGKTSFINVVSGANLRVGRGLSSCTNTVEVAPSFQLDGRTVTLIDTPGFDDTSRSDTDILSMIAAFLAQAYENGKKLAGVIYMHRISDVRMGGISTRNFKMFRQLCGESSLRNVVIVTTMWSEVGLAVGEAREAELAAEDRFFKPVLDKGARLLRHDNNTASGHAILHYLVDNQPRALRIQRELVDQGKDISQTAAGEELNRELAEQLKRHREEMIVLQNEMKGSCFKVLDADSAEKLAAAAIREKDEETKKELEIETRKLQAEMARVQNDSQKLASDYSEQKAQLERRMAEVAEAAKREAESADANHRRQIQELEDRLHQSTVATAAEKDDIRRQLSDLQRQYEEARHSQPRRIGFFGKIGRALDSTFRLV